MNRKGMSQTLALIVAAMVLMMTALTLIFMTQGSLQDLFSGSERQSCISTVKAQCSTGAETVDTPATCLDEQGQPSVDNPAISSDSTVCADLNN